MHTVHPTRDTGYSLLPGRQFLHVIEFHLDISCMCWKLLTDGQVSERGDVGSQYWMVPKAMCSQPRTWEGSPDGGEGGILGCRREETAPCCGSHQGGGCLSRRVGEELARMEGSSLGWGRTERLGPFSRALKGAEKGRKNKSRHTLGGCWLAQPLGTPSPWMPGNGTQPARPWESTPD